MGRAWALPALALVVAVACAGSAPAIVSASASAQPTASRTPTKPPRAKITVAMGAQGSLILLPWDVAKALGYFEDENLDVEFQFYPAAPQAAAALLAGTADFAGNSLDHSIRAQLQGKPTKMVVSFARLPGFALLVRSDQKDKIRSLRDLRGATIAIPSAGSGAHILLTYLLKTQADLEPDKDYRVQAVAASAQAAALDKGEVLAAMAGDPFLTDYTNAGKGFVLVDLRREDDALKVIGGRYQFTGAVTRDDLIQKDPALVQRVVNSLVRADRYIARTRSEEIAAALPATITGSNKDLYVATLEAARQYLSPDGLIDRGSVDNVIKVNLVFGSLYPQLALLKPSDKVDVDALFDMGFVQTVR